MSYTGNKKQHKPFSNIEPVICEHNVRSERDPRRHTQGVELQHTGVGRQQVHAVDDNRIPQHARILRIGLSHRAEDEVRRRGDVEVFL